MPAKRPTRPKSKPQVLLLGVGFDGDGEKRVTKGRDFLLVGGSKDTHDAMTEHAVRVDEELVRRGRRLADLRCVEELREILHKAAK
jgi:hypothetical protein